VLHRQLGLLDDHPAQSDRQKLVVEQPQTPLARRPPGASGPRQRHAQPQRGPGHERRCQRRHNVAMTGLQQAPWWTVRPAANTKPSTYRCPICSHHLPALSEHMLIAPEGDTRRRRHAHTQCVMKARASGELRLREEWQAQQPQQPSVWRHLLRRS